MSRRPDCALYHRVSTVDQDPHLAARELHAAAARLGYRVVLDERETARSSAQRPGLARILNAARHGHIAAVLVWKLDRFGRSSLDLLTNLAHLETAGVRFVAISQGLDLKPHGDAVSRLILGVLAATAEWEREIIRERTRLGLAAARSRGQRLGRPPEKPIPQLADVNRLRRAGRSWSAVAKALGCSVWMARVVAGVERGSGSYDPRAARAATAALLPARAAGPRRSAARHQRQRKRAATTKPAPARPTSGQRGARRQERGRRRSRGPRNTSGNG
jgi:DNA invertase Pin-like site-specific DNA recombinase